MPSPLQEMTYCCVMNLLYRSAEEDQRHEGGLGDRQRMGHESETESGTKLKRFGADRKTLAER
ncbi:hypothetical protein HKBW3S06_01427, partial [Candidatus Hakubella thermalkaliphila]